MFTENDFGVKPTSRQSETSCCFCGETVLVEPGPVLLHTGGTGVVCRDCIRTRVPRLAILARAARLAAPRPHEVDPASGTPDASMPSASPAHEPDPSSAPDPEQVEANLADLVAALRSFGAVTVVEAREGRWDQKAGEAEVSPLPQLDATASGWFVKFTIDRTAFGWDVFEVLRWAIDVCGPEDGDRGARLLSTVRHPGTYGIGNLTYMLVGPDGSDPDAVAGSLWDFRDHLGWDVIYRATKSPHTGKVEWRSRYEPLNAQAGTA